MSIESASSNRQTRWPSASAVPYWGVVLRLMAS